jgi:hypothetical protein
MCSRYRIIQHGGICKCDQEDEDLFWKTLDRNDRNTSLDEHFRTYSNRKDVEKSKELVNTNKDLIRRNIRRHIQIANTAWNIHSKIKVSLAWIAAMELDL